MGALVMVTTYLGPVGAPLYCSTPDNPLVFSDSIGPFVAMPVEDYISGRVQCSQWYRLTFADGSILMARALDAGPFSRYCVRQKDGSCPSIAVDVPGYYWPVGGISGWATIEAVRRYVH